jgi:hypothetical protein
MTALSVATQYIYKTAIITATLTLTDFWPHFHVWLKSNRLSHTFSTRLLIHDNILLHPAITGGVPKPNPELWIWI